MNKEAFELLLKQAGISQRLRRDIRFKPEAFDGERDFVVMMNKSFSEGVLIAAFDRQHIMPFRLQKRSANSKGRVEAIICDICATWQRGSNSAVLTFLKEKSTQSFLVCADLNCSMHVRDQTLESKLSRTQLRENISEEKRIARLNERLETIISQM